MRRFRWTYTRLSRMMFSFILAMLLLVVGIAAVRAETIIAPCAQAVQEVTGVGGTTRQTVVPIEIPT